MIKKTVQKKNSDISLENTKDIELSIQFSLDGFSFCISDSLLKNDVYFNEYKFEPSHNSAEDLLKEIKTIFKNDSNLQLEYSSISIIHQNNLSTVVPNEYFDENILADYLNYNIKTLKSDFIAYEDIITLETKNVYIPYVNINNFLFQNFGEFEYKHHQTILLEKLIKANKSDEKTMYINVSNKTFDIVVLEKDKLILINSFSYLTKEDFIYYILFTAEQLQLNTEEFELFFTGNISIESDTYKITYTYIKNIFFLESENSIYNKLELAKHSNFILLG